MQILITGGTGFIGRRLVARLLSKGHRLTILSRQDARDVHRLLSTEVKPVKSLSAVKPSEAFDAIVNLAGEGVMDKRWTPSRKRQLLNSRIALTSELVDLTERMENRPDCLISGSAIGFYGGRDDAARLDESSGAGDDFAAGLCIRWEQAAVRAKDLGLRVCLVRTGVVLHPEGGALREMMLPFRLGIGGPLGSGKQMMSWIHMEDMVNALEFLLENDSAEGAFNATAPEAVSNKDFAVTLAGTLNRPAFLKMPAMVLRGMLGESSEMVLKGQNIYPQRLMAEGFSFTYPQLKPALTQLIGA
ncbi:MULTISPECIES: TIGR01777 family oxidoreductase [unclassified Endozoicomonas]|uniref:TIGR01777 family oxidoreductase n=1 Tax=unclassified Endozoicomonas TaxID=2644528 RepID=UPI0021482198|nr:MULTISPECIES: TIGR01777 family oxidoreductase [unclassified Endozoicomonas]